MRVSRSDVSARVSTQRESARHGRERDVVVALRHGSGIGLRAEEAVARRARREARQDGIPAGRGRERRLERHFPRPRAPLHGGSHGLAPVAGELRPFLRGELHADELLGLGDGRGGDLGPDGRRGPEGGGRPAAGVDAVGGVCASACTPVTSAAAEAAVVVRNSRRDFGMVILSVRRRGERGKPATPRRRSSRKQSIPGGRARPRTPGPRGPRSRRPRPRDNRRRRS